MNKICFSCFFCILVQSVTNVPVKNVSIQNLLKHLSYTEKITCTKFSSPTDWSSDSLGPGCSIHVLMWPLPFPAIISLLTPTTSLKLYAMQTAYHSSNTSEHFDLCSFYLEWVSSPNLAFSSRLNVYVISYERLSSIHPGRKNNFSLQILASFSHSF